jgi:alkanesulfonate monooxygenase SsuD/methylene tetrahydromethanopterin reductase-like flavin-dependent oxidoreductase (luciferase family)
MPSTRTFTWQPGAEAGESILAELGGHPTVEEGAKDAIVLTPQSVEEEAAEFYQLTGYGKFVNVPRGPHPTHPAAVRQATEYVRGFGPGLQVLDRPPGPRGHSGFVRPSPF